jgi:hypothetical protein
VEEQMIDGKPLSVSIPSLLFLFLSICSSTMLAIFFSLTVPASAYGEDRPPVAFDQHVTFATDQFVSITLTGDDPDGDRLNLFSVETPPEHLSEYGGTAAAVTCAFQGRCLWIAPSGFTGTDSVTFTVVSCRDDSGICTTSAPATISIDIVDSLSEPVAFPQYITWIPGTPVGITLTGNDPFLTYAITSGPTNGQLSVVYDPVVDENVLTYTPELGFIGQDSFLFTASDANTTSAPAAITINLVSGPAIVSSVLPGSRSVPVDSTATAYATILNTGPGTATQCTIAPTTVVPADFSYQTTDPITNAPIGTPNTPVDIASSAGQTFLLTFIPNSDILETEVQLRFACTNADPAPVIVGVNTLLLSAATFPIPDIIAVNATINNDGIVAIPGETGSGVFAVATANVGAAGAITVSADTGGVTLPVNVLVCETNPATSVCLAEPGPEVTTTIGSNATPTFGVFVVGGGTVPFDPASNRIFVRFKDAGGVTRGATSVAARTVP